MKIRFDLQFFPALRDILDKPDHYQLQQRNKLRLDIARNTNSNVYRPHPEIDESYPREEA